MLNCHNDINLYMQVLVMVSQLVQSIHIILITDSVVIKFDLYDLSTVSYYTKLTHLERSQKAMVSIKIDIYL